MPTRNGSKVSDLRNLVTVAGDCDGRTGGAWQAKAWRDEREGVTFVDLRLWKQGRSVHVILGPDNIRAMAAALQFAVGDAEKPPDRPPPRNKPAPAYQTARLF